MNFHCAKVPAKSLKSLRRSALASKCVEVASVCVEVQRNQQLSLRRSACAKVHPYGGVLALRAALRPRTNPLGSWGREDRMSKRREQR